MHSNQLPLSYFTLGAQFLRLAHESCVEIVNSGNKHVVLTDKPLKPSEYGRIVRWSDHSVGTAVLFSFFHGIELILKGFLTARSVARAHHRLTELLSEFELAFPGTELGEEIKNALPAPGRASPISRFLVTNSIQIDSWYDALKYPESKKGQAYSHFDLKFGGSNTLPFWQQIHRSSADIHAKAVALSRAHGYA